MEHSLRELGLVDVPESDEFARFTRLATTVLGVPVSLVSVVDAENDRQFFTSASGLPEPWASARQTPLTHSFCQHVIENDTPFVVDDARGHPIVGKSLAIRELSVAAYLGVPFADPSGQRIGAMCAIDTEPRAWSERDISIMTDLAASVTSQIDLKASLLASEETRRTATRFGRVVENAHHEVFMFEPDTLRFSHVNKGARKNLGFSLEELRMLTPVDIKPEFSQEEFEAFIKPLLNGDAPYLEFETTHMRKSGSIYPVSIRLERHCEDDDVFIAFVEDITERRKLEAALAEETNNFLAFFNYAPEAMSVAKMDTTIIQANTAFEELFGLDPKQMIGRQFIDYVPDSYKQNVRDGFDKLTPENPIFSILIEHELNGVPKSLIWSNLVLFEDKKATKIFSIAKDVTELSIAKTRAEESAEEARKAIEIRKIFLANMSHEVRTPLNAIMGLFQLIQMADVPERQRKQAEVGLNASHHLLSQLVNVLELSSVEANAVAIMKKPTEVRTLATHWLETATATKHRLGKQIELSLEITQSTPELFDLDERRVTQIVNNLVDNALKFTSEGEVAIHIGPTTDSASGTSGLEIMVSDTGCGIGSDQSDQVFDRFVQLDGAHTRENSGSGLGLAISRELATLMGATLEITQPALRDCFVTTFSLRL